MTVNEVKHTVKLLSKTHRESKDEDRFTIYLYDYEVEHYTSEKIYTFCIECEDLSSDFNDSDWKFITHYFNIEGY